MTEGQWGGKQGIWGGTGTGRSNAYFVASLNGGPPGGAEFHLGWHTRYAHLLIAVLFALNSTFNGGSLYVASVFYPHKVWIYRLLFVTLFFFVCLYGYGFLHRG